jgi:hypothetical protein
MEEATKTCSKCGETKALSEFALRNNSKDGYTGQCKSCLNDKHQKHRDRNREEVRKQARDWAYAHRTHILNGVRKWRRDNRFKKTLQQSRAAAKRYGHLPCSATAEELQDSFTGFCAICGVPETECTHRLNMDHDHETGQFRGWLCGKCNRLLGMANNNKEILLNAGTYLEKCSLRGG